MIFSNDQYICMISLIFIGFHSFSWILIYFQLSSMIVIDFRFTHTHWGGGGAKPTTTPTGGGGHPPWGWGHPPHPTPTPTGGEGGYTMGEGGRGGVNPEPWIIYIYPPAPACQGPSGCEAYCSSHCFQVPQVLSITS